ncbi:MAG: formamidopyrimidine-DNA glycosylase [Bryobacterales bacterium]|nr:formamidopyrimidine-DNA glycosylase [Acidobacteriota bacterium]MCB9383665.1 formamidopyrimidine-DNA glycosylase [Bryobacterales bacterium]
MPELPDVTVYVEALEKRIAGERLLGIRLASPFLLRTLTPPVSAFAGRRVETLRRVGKRIVWGLEGDLWLSIHLMIAGRLHWRKPGAKPGGKGGLAAFDFEPGTLLLDEVSKKKRASLHLLSGPEAWRELDPGGLEPLETGLDAFAATLTKRNHTLKRALTDPTLFSGIGNAYSDEILFAAGLSPIALTQKLAPDEIARLHAAVQSCLGEWTERLRAEAGEKFPEKVTAFRPEMAVHGRFKEPCRTCGGPVQRIRYAENETNYCPACQTGGRLLADRSLSRLLGKDWPRSLDEMDARLDRGKAGSA